jgi:hypothetical protein
MYCSLAMMSLPLLWLSYLDLENKQYKLMSEKVQTSMKSFFSLKNVNQRLYSRSVCLEKNNINPILIPHCEIKVENFE